MVMSGWRACRLGLCCLRSGSSYHCVASCPFPTALKKQDKTVEAGDPVMHISTAWPLLLLPPSAVQAPQCPPIIQLSQPTHDAVAYSQRHHAAPCTPPHPHPAGGAAAAAAADELRVVLPARGPEHDCQCVPRSTSSRRRATRGAAAGDAHRALGGCQLRGAGNADVPQ